MQQIRFEREKMNSYMVMQCVEKLDRNAYGEVLLEHAKIPGLMNYEIRELDGEQTLYYRLNYRTSLKQVLGDLKLTLELVEGMISSIVNVVKQTEEYLLDANAILWKSEYTFIEIHSGCLSFAYYPKLQDENNSIKNFLVELIQYIDKNNRQAYMYLMGFYNLVTNPDCTVEQMEQYKMSRAKETEMSGLEIEVDEPFVTSFGQEKSISHTSNGVNKKTSSKGWFVIAILAVVNLGVTCLLLFDIWTYQYIWVLIVTLFLLFVAFLSVHPEKEEENPDKIMEEYLKECRENQTQENHQQNDIEKDGMNMETTVLCLENQQIVVEDKPKELCLKSLSPKEYGDLIIDKNSVVLGSMKNGCSYVVKKSGISRMHAKLVRKEDGLFLLDLNSTNGTYLNDEQIMGGREYLLEEGDVISLANIVTFVVKSTLEQGLM